MADSHRQGILPSTMLYNVVVPRPGYTAAGPGSQQSVGTNLSNTNNMGRQNVMSASGTRTTSSANSNDSPVEAVFIPETVEMKKSVRGEDTRVAAWGGSTSSMGTQNSNAGTPIRGAALSSSGRRPSNAQQQVDVPSTGSTPLLATPPPRRSQKTIPADEAIVKLPPPLRLAFVPSQMCRCYVLRERESLFGGNFYRMYHEASNEFLAAGRKRSKKQTVSYLIGLDASKLDRESDECIAKLRGSVSGLDFVIASSNRDDRRELGCVMYTVNPAGIRGVRSLRVLLPKVLSNGQMEEWRPSSESQWSALLNAYGKISLPELPADMVVLNSREPSYNQEAKTHQLHFGGRVTQSSVKNFQLYDARDPSAETVLQFGKVSEDRFNLDFRYPVNPLQAFAMALTSFDGKLMLD